MITNCSGFGNPEHFLHGFVIHFRNPFLNNTIILKKGLLRDPLKGDASKEKPLAVARGFSFGGERGIIRYFSPISSLIVINELYGI